MSAIRCGEIGHINGFSELPCGFDVVAFQSRHQVFISVHCQSANHRETDIRVDGVDEVAVGVGVDVVNHDQIGSLARFKRPDLVVPVGGDGRT